MSNVGLRVRGARSETRPVVYPASASSTFALPRTRRNDGRSRVHGSSCASVYESTMRERAWMFWSARSSVSVPPCDLNLGDFDVIASNVAITPFTIGPMSASVWCAPSSEASASARPRVAADEFSVPM